jgi:3-phenylpropionate/cinnamic acid dioxygenase small subunit
MPDMSAEDLAIATDLLAREAAAIDERRWEDWLGLFHPDCEYWAPSWRDEETLTSDPQREISLFYHPGRAGLEDRVWRIRSGRSPASMPLHRTAHLITNIHLGTPAEAGWICAHSTWATHFYDPKHKESHAFFGRSQHDLAKRDGTWGIAKKRLVLLNDYIPSILDIHLV